MGEPAGKARSRPEMIATSSCSWTATVRTSPSSSRASSGRSRAGEADFVIGSRLRGTRAPGSMSAHQILAGLALGYAMRLCPWRALHRHVRFPRDPPLEPDDARHARDDLWLEYRDADAGGGREAAHPRIAGRLRLARRRRLEGRRQPARHAAAPARASSRPSFRVWREMGRKER